MQNKDMGIIEMIEFIKRTIPEFDKKIKPYRKYIEEKTQKVGRRWL